MILILLVVGIGAFVSLQFLSPSASDDNSEQGTSTLSDTSYADAISEAKDVVKISNRATLDLSSQGLTKVPMDTFEKIETETLDLSSNNLSGSLPAEVRHLQNLRVFDLSDNNFTGVPAEIGQLSKLETLNLSGNPITGLPLELGNLKNLKVLDLRNTNYSEYDLGLIKGSLASDVTIYTK